MTPSAKLKQLWDARIATIIQERDEAREAALWLAQCVESEDYDYFYEAKRKWPWLAAKEE